MDSLKNIVWNGVKLAGCGAIIAGIAFGFAVMNTEGGVDVADADVFWAGPSSYADSNQQKFLKVLEREGFSEPQAYDWNGNTMYFSRAQTSRAPKDAAIRLQETMVQEGLNNHAYPMPVNPQVLRDDDALPSQKIYATKAMQDFFTGGLIPTVDTGDYVVLNGIEMGTEGPIDMDGQMLMEMFMTYDGDDFADMFSNMRYIEVFRPEGSQTTHKIAVFGDGETDFQRFQPGAGAQDDTPRGEAGSIPACPGCERNTRFSGKDSQVDYQMYTFNSPDSVENVMHFYRQAMAIRGWQPSTGHEVAKQMRSRMAPHDAPDRMGQMDVFVRDGKTLQIHAYPAKDVGTHVDIFTGS